MLAGRRVSASRCSRGIVIASSPVNTIASLTNRARKRPSGCRHSTAAAVSAPISVAARQMICPSCKREGRLPRADGGLRRPSGGFPTYRPSTHATTTVLVSPPRQGSSDGGAQRSADEDHGHHGGEPDRHGGAPARPPEADQREQPHRDGGQQRPVAGRPQRHPPPGVAQVQPLRVVRGHPPAPGQVRRDGRTRHCRNQPGNTAIHADPPAPRLNPSTCVRHPSITRLPAKEHAGFAR